MVKIGVHLRKLSQKYNWGTVFWTTLYVRGTEMSLELSFTARLIRYLHQTNKSQAEDVERQERLQVPKQFLTSIIIIHCIGLLL